MHSFITLVLALMAAANTSETQLAFQRSHAQLKQIIALSKQGRWTLLGGQWIVSEGELTNLSFPSSLYPAPLTLNFFVGRKNLIYAHNNSAKEVDSLVAMDVDGKKYHEIASFEHVRAIAISPDNQRVAIVSKRGRLLVMELSSHKTQDLAPAWPSRPSWSPDGKFIAFEKNRDQEQGWAYSEIAVASLDSGTITVLDKGRFPSWSPKGDFVAYTDIDGKQLIINDPRGRNARGLKKNWAAVMGPIEGPLVWSPDQQMLILNRVHDDLYGEQHTKVYLFDILHKDMKALVRDEVVLGWR